MPDGATKEERKREKYRRRQNEVFDAAAAVFAGKGYHGASTGDIAAELGIAQSSLYYYFKSKDEALEQVCREGIKGYVERIEIIAAGPQSAEQKIREAICSHIEPIKTIPHYFRTFVGELRYLPKSRRTELNRMISDYNKSFEKILQEGVEDTSLNQNLDCRLVVLQLISQCNLAPFWAPDSKEPDFDRVATSIADNFLWGATRRQK